MNKNLYLIQEIIKVESHILTLKFNTNEILKVNIEPKLQELVINEQSSYHQLLDTEYFNTLKYSNDRKSIFWENNINFSADMLYELGHESLHLPILEQFDLENIDTETIKFVFTQSEKQFQDLLQRSEGLTTKGIQLLTIIVSLLSLFTISLFK